MVTVACPTGYLSAGASGSDGACTCGSVRSPICTCMILSLSLCFTWNIYIVPYNCIYNCIWFLFKIFLRFFVVASSLSLYIAIIVLCCLCGFFAFLLLKSCYILLFLGYFYVLFAIIVSYIYLYIYLYNCVYMLIHILSTLLSTLSTDIIVYNCVCEFQKIYHNLLPYHIYLAIVYFASLYIVI